MTLKRALPPIVFAAMLGVLAWLSSPSQHANAAGGFSSTIAVTTSDNGALAFGGVTGTTGGSANALFTASKDRRLLLVTNTLNAEVVVTIGGLAAADLLQATAGTMPIPLGANYLAIPSGTVVGVYAPSGAPASGKISIQGL